ncbi:MAG: hypothetical protein Q7U10_07115 [Thermodesulfovibrionia bacterium]|nr:hypothetical protein [Thermodesulfovibrionia bacterium]
MKKDYMSLILSNKKSVVLVAAIIAAFVYIIVISTHITSVNKKRDALKAQLAELSSLGAGIMEIKQLVESKERKIASASPKGIVATLDEILISLSMKAEKLKPADKKRADEYVEENAELEIKNIDLNGIVNFLYKIDSAPEPMKVKSIDMQTSFANKDIFSLNLTVSLLSKAQ